MSRSLQKNESLLQISNIYIETEGLYNPIRATYSSIIIKSNQEVFAL